MTSARKHDESERYPFWMRPTDDGVEVWVRVRVADDTTMALNWLWDAGDELELYDDGWNGSVRMNGTSTE